LDFTQFAGDLDKVLCRSAKAGVTGFLVPSVEAAKWAALLSLKIRYPHIKIALGLHPYFIQNHQQSHIEQLEEQVAHHHDQICAIGEIGLDLAPNNHCGSYLDKQVTIFSQQVDIAKEAKLPIIVHHRKSHNQLIQILKQRKFQNGGVIHGFSGSYAIAKTYIDLGFKLGIGGTITYSRANKTISTLKSLTLDDLLLETDAPDMPIQGHQGQRNSPEYLPIIAASLAEHLNVNVEDVIKQTSINFHSVFGD
jgi:TatD DNase family protein